MILFSGSIIVTFDLSTAEDDIDASVNTIYNYVQTGCDFTHNSASLTCADTLNMDGEPYSQVEVEDNNKVKQMINLYISNLGRLECSSWMPV